MHDTAIRLIQDTAIAANGAVAERLPDHMVAMPAGTALVDIEKNLENRTRFRGTFTTKSMPDFIDYVIAKGADTGHAEGFIDAEKHAAKVFFNLRDANGAGHGDWTANLNLKATAAYKALQDIEGDKALTQRQVIDFLEDWNRHVTLITTDDGEAVTLPQAINAFRTLTIASKKDSKHEEGERRAARTAMEEIEAKAGPQTPDRITFSCEPFLGLPQREFVLRVGILTSHDDPRIKLRMVAKEEQEEAIAQDFKDALDRALEDDATLTVGTFTP